MKTGTRGTGTGMDDAGTRMSGTAGTPFLTETPAATEKIASRERPRVSLTLKIFLAVAGIVFVALGSAIEISRVRVRAIAEAASRKALVRAKDSYDTFEDDRYEKLHRALRVVVDNAGFKALVATADPETIANSLKEDQASAAGADFLIVTDPQGISLVRSDKREWRHDLSSSGLVRKALDGAETEGVWFSEGKLYNAVAAPVIEGEGASSRTTGLLIACFGISNKVAENFRDVSNTDVVFFSDSDSTHQSPKPELVASTLGGRSRSFADAFGRQSDLARGVFDRGVIAGPFSLETAEDSYLGLSWPLRLSSGVIVGAVVAVRSMSTELAAFREIEKTLLIVGGLGLLLAFVISFFLARAITGPIEVMVEATESVRDGNYAANLPVEKKDEIGILARSFRRMIGELEEKAELEKQIASLTMAGLGGGQATEAQKTQAIGGSPAETAGGLPQIGELFAGRYSIEQELGAGGMGIVFRAHDRVLDDTVAIKALKSDALAQDATLLDRFKQEIRLARKITHRNVLRTHDFGEHLGLRYLSMEYVRGITLKHLLRQSGKLPTPAALRIARQICSGLSAAHGAGVVHRDIKPQNILIEPTGGLKIMDFGIARLSRDKGITATGMVVGTPDYMSPEQAKGSALDHRSDIYSTGVVFYELFTGTLPYEGDSALGVVLKHIQENPPPPESKNADIDPRISRIILKAMEKNPDNRFQSVQELYRDLSEVSA
jgi:HAMP domain-containing protein/tRNA A-37 threonylcarbamoyl transferase component Bud32